MQFGYKTTSYLKSVGAVLQKSEYKILQIDFTNLKAFVNKVDTYKKRNNKLCTVEHCIGKWVSFPKDAVRYGIRTEEYETNDWSIGDREIVTRSFRTKYLSKEAKQEIINTYHKIPHNP